MRSFVRSHWKLASLSVLLCFLGAPVAMAGVEDTFVIAKRVVKQLLGGDVDGSGATTGQALVKQSDGSWKPGTVGGGSQTLAQTLANGNTTPNGTGIIFKGSGGEQATVAGTSGSAGMLSISGPSANGCLALLQSGGATKSCLTWDGAGGLDLGTSNGSTAGALYLNLVEVNAGVGAGSVAFGQGSIADGTDQNSDTVLTAFANKGFLVAGSPVSTVSGTHSLFSASTTFGDGGSTSTAVAQACVFKPTINYTAASKTGHYEALVVNAVETSLPSGTNYLMRLQAGASGGTDEFTVTNGGSVFFNGATITGPKAATTFGLTANSGTNAASSNLTFATGVGTGNATAATMNFQVAPIGASGTSAQTLGTVLTLSGVQNNLSGTADLAALSATLADGGTTSSTTARGLHVSLTSNYTAASRTGAVEAFAVDYANTSAPSGSNKLAALRVGGSLKFDVDLSGNTTAAGNYATGNNGSIAIGVLYAQTQVAGSNTYQLDLNDFTSATTGTGGGIRFNGWKNGQTGSSPFALINGVKENATAGNSAGTLVFATSVNSANPDPKWAITSAGALQGRSGMVLAWNSSSTDPTVTSAADTGISRFSSGLVAFGTGAAANTAGSIVFLKATAQAGGGYGLLGNQTAGNNISWGTGGTFNATTAPEIIGPSDVDMFVSASSTSSTTAGRNIQVSGGVGGGTSGAGGGATLSGGPATAGATNEAAGGATVTTGLGTGNATSDILGQTGFALASGTTTQTAYDRVRVTSKTKALSTTTATNTVFCNLTNAVTDSGVGCVVEGTIELIDGTHHVGAIHFCVPFSGVNQNGVVTAGVVPVLGTSNASITTGGTYTSLTTTFTCVASGTNLQLGVTPTWAAGTPTTVRLTYKVLADGQATIAPQ